MTPERLERRRQRIMLAALTAGILGLICGVAAVLVQRSNSEAAVRRSTGQLEIALAQNRALSEQLSSVAASLAEQQDLSRCRVERAARVDLVTLAFYGLYIPGEDGRVIDVAEFNRQRAEAIADAEGVYTGTTCPTTS